MQVPAKEEKAEVKSDKDFNGLSLTRIRRLRGLTMFDLAQTLSGIGAGTIGKYERGVKFPKRDVVLDFAEVLECHPDDFYGQLFDEDFRESILDTLRIQFELCMLSNDAKTKRIALDIVKLLYPNGISPDDSDQIKSNFGFGNIVGIVEAEIVEREESEPDEV